MGQTTRVSFEAVFLNSDPPDDERANQLIRWAQRFDKLGLDFYKAGSFGI